MIKQKQKSFKVILDNPEGKFVFMTIVGCVDMDDCIDHVMKTKDKDFTISQITEITKAKK